MTQISFKLTISLLLIMALQFLNLQHHVEHLGTDVNISECTICHHSGNMGDAVPPTIELHAANLVQKEAATPHVKSNAKTIANAQFTIRGPPRDYPNSIITI